MHFARSIRWSIPLVLVLMILCVSSAFGDGPADEGTPSTPFHWGNPFAMIVSAPLDLSPAGIRPDQAVEPNGTWLFLDPGANHWYQIVDSRMKLAVWLDANGQEGIGMEIFAPEQHDVWNNKPVGRGTHSTIEKHDLFWAGKTAAWGTWLIRVVNNSENPINYSLGYERMATRKADYCAVCHGWNIEWESCEDSEGSTHCGGLKSEYNE